MCFGSGSNAQSAEVTKQQEIQKRDAEDELAQERKRVTDQKQKTVEAAVSKAAFGGSSVRQGGSGRRSLFASQSGGRGFFSRFG